MTLKKIISFLLLLISVQAFSQGEANIWYFGNKAGLDFNSNEPVPITDSQMTTIEGCATISDHNGNLLFYTNGQKIWNKNHEIMSGGHFLLGHESSTNSSIIIPKPEDINIYYIFTTGTWTDERGLNYTEVDMRLDNGLGAVTEYINFNLHREIAESLTSVKHPNGSDYWVLTHLRDTHELAAYKVTNSGIQSPVISSGTEITNDYSTTMKFSSDGRSVAIANATDDSDVILYDFNNLTGAISNPKKITGFSPLHISYGLEFSPNNRLLYVSEYGSNLYQFNASLNTAEEIIDSKVRIASSTNELGALQLAPNGKIYVAKNNNPILGVITNPNTQGFDADYNNEGISMGNNSFYGLPSYVQSFFSNLKYIDTYSCLGEEKTFNLDENTVFQEWDFDDSASGISNFSNAFSPSHTFTSPGIYNVQVYTLNSLRENFTTIFSVTVPEEANLSIDDISVYDLSENNTITIAPQNSNFNIHAYEYGIENNMGTIEYQSSPILEHVKPGIQKIYIRDNFQCTMKSIEVSIVGYKLFFTPNEDGYNDTWHILGVNQTFYSKSIVNIFDRFGKNVANIDAKSDGWDGYYNGNKLPAADYWFSARVIDRDGNTIQRNGHFSLIR